MPRDNPKIVRAGRGWRPPGYKPLKPPKSKPPKRPPRRTNLPPIPPMGGGNALASIFGPYESWINSQLAAEQARAKAEAFKQQALMQGYAKWYAEHIPQQIQQIYGNAANTQVGFAKGFSDGMAIAQQQAAAEANKLIANAHAPEGQMIKPTSAAADVLYGLGGFLPGSTLSTQGAAFSSAASIMPGAIAAEGAKQARGILEDSSKVVESLLGKQAEVKSKKAEARAKLQEAQQKQAIDLYNEGVLTQRQLAKALGLKDWRRYPNSPKPTSHGGIDAAASKLMRYLVYDDGTPVLDRKGKPIPIAQEPASPTSRSLGGYIYERDPVTGQWHPVAGTGRASDQPPSVDETTLAKAADWAKKAYWRGVPTKGNPRFDAQGRRIDTGGKKLKPMTWENAVSYVLSHLPKGTPRWVAEEALARWYKPGRFGRPKASAALDGGRKNTSYSLGLSIVETASKAIGSNYVWGGESFAEGGFDCSGLLYWAFAQHGIKIPRTSQTQWRYGTPVSQSDLQPGDAVFFSGYTGGKGGPGHVAMYIGNGQILVAPRTGDVVKIVPLSSMSGYMGARRFTSRSRRV